MGKKLGLDGAIYYHGNKYPWLNLSDHTKYDSTQASVFHQVGLQSELANPAAEKWHYRVPFAFSYLRNKQEEQENQGDLHAKIRYDLKENLFLKVHTGLWVSKYQYKQGNTPSRHLERFQPSFIFLVNDLKFQAGFNLVYHNHSTEPVKPLNAYPIFQVNYQPFKWLRPYIGLGGDIQPHAWHHFIADNPWLVVQPELRHTNQSFSLYGGIKGEITAQAAFHAGARIDSYQNLPFFVNSASVPRQLAIEYDPETSLVNVFGELSHTNHAANWVNRLKGNYYHYKLKQLPKPWHKPSYQVDLLSTYNLYDKILLKGNLYWLGGIEALDPNTQAAKPLPAVVNLGLGIDYLWNQRFSIFLDCQNLLARTHARYLNTPARGFGFLVGVAYTW